MIETKSISVTAGALKEFVLQGAWAQGVRQLLLGSYFEMGA